MLHEVLLALSGHPSPLFERGKSESLPSNLLSPSEAALLDSIGKLARDHHNVRQHVEHIAASHRSIICRAVATSILQTHLARFQRRILDVEAKILTKDVTVVGAYDIVPLAGVVAQFNDWHRLMAWYWHIACLMQPVSPAKDQQPTSTGCSGASLIDTLRSEASTGYPQIETAAIELSRIAETAWLRQLSSWLVYGKLPSNGADDFFVRMDASAEATDFVREKRLLPGFVTSATASAILFAGKSLHKFQEAQQKQTLTGIASNFDAINLAKTHIEYLASLTLPILSSQLSRAVSQIRLSLSRNVLQHLLPLEQIATLLRCQRRYLLLGQGEFAVALIDQAEKHLQARQQSMGRLLQKDPAKALQGLSLKDVELQDVLTRTWKALAHQDDEEGDDMELDFATANLKLSTAVRKTTRPSSANSVSADMPAISPVKFNDLLLPAEVDLRLDVGAPFDLFLSTQEVDIYSSVNAYLLATRRAQVKLADLWKRTAARRDHPSPSGRSGPSVAKSKSSVTRANDRARSTRKIWATASAALFLISETATYFEGEVVRESCEQFEAWVKAPVPADTQYTNISSDRDVASEAAPADPETLACGHRTFLAALIYALLLTDVPFTRELRSLLGNVDAVIAFFTRLLDVQQKLDIEHDSEGETAYTVQEEQRVSLELDRARKRVDSDLRSVVNRLRQLDHERIGSGRFLNVNASVNGGYEPWKGGGVDRLLIKLEFARMNDVGYDIRPLG